MHNINIQQKFSSSRNKVRTDRRFDIDVEDSTIFNICEGTSTDRHNHRGDVTSFGVRRNSEIQKNRT